MDRNAQQVKSPVVKVVSEESWEFFIREANNQGCPVAVHFTASWCFHSVVMNPLFKELALSYQDVLFLSVDVDDAKGVVAKLGIKALPSFVLMNEGNQIDKVVGAYPHEVRKRVDGFVDSIRSYKAK